MDYIELRFDVPREKVDLVSTFLVAGGYDTFEVCDLSHTEDITHLLQKRAKKKENAVVFADGVYVYLICTDQNEAISRYLKP